MTDEKFNEMLFNIFIAACVLFIIMLPRFCFKASEEDIQKYKEIIKK